MPTRSSRSWGRIIGKDGIDSCPGEVAAAADVFDEAREHWRAALEIFKIVEVPQDTLATLEKLVETCRGEDDEEQPWEWCHRARDVITDALDSVATRHRDWINYYLSERDGE